MATTKERPQVCSKCYRSTDEIKFKKPFLVHPTNRSIMLCPYCQGSCLGCGKTVPKDQFHCTACCTPPDPKRDAEPKFSDDPRVLGRYSPRDRDLP